MSLLNVSDVLQTKIKAWKYLSLTRDYFKYQKLVSSGHLDVTLWSIYLG